MKNQKSGFTLIELSIVLVIVGLIVGGVLVGQTMIRNAEVRATLSQIEKLNTSVGAFRNKYKCLPGDCQNATRFFTASSQPQQVSNGNGDGKMMSDTIYDDAFYVDTEKSYAFDHLANAGMIDMAPFDEADTTASTWQAGGNHPKSRIGGGIHMFFHRTENSHYFAMGMTIPSDGSDWFNTVPSLILAADAHLLDAKIDDGAPLTGKMYAVYEADYSEESYDFTQKGQAHATWRCVRTGTGNPYHIASQNKCTVAIKAGF